MTEEEYSGEYQKTNKDNLFTKAAVSVSSQVSKGTEGDKFLADVRVLADVSGEHTRSFFIKRPNELPDCPETTHAAILEKYKWLKSNGFPVPPTYRYDEARKEFVITDMNRLGEIYDKANPLKKEINNLDEIITEIKKLAKLSFNDGNGVYLGLDAYSVVVDGENNGHVWLLDLGRGSYRVNEGVDEKGGQSFLIMLML